MGTFSVRNLRADTQNVAMRNKRTFPRLMRFLLFYLATCVAVYLFFRYYLTNDHDYGTPMPAAFIHENVLRPLKSFPSVKLTVSPNELFEKLYYHKIRTRPGTFHEPSWHKTKNDFVTKPGDSSEKGDEFIPDSLGLQEKGDNNSSLSSLVINVSSTSNSSIHQNDNFDGSQDDILVEETSTKGKTYSSLIAPNQVNNRMKLSLLHNISSLQRTSNSSSTIWHRYQDFRSEWFRQRRARVDWRSMIQPCIDNLAWGLVKNQWGKTNRSSAAASEIVYQEIKAAGEFSKIFIQSKTVNNQTKLIGGDTWRVYLRGPSSVAATVFDHQNGTYEALFLLTEPGIYQVLIFLDYSLCDGFKDPPPDWFIQGNAQGKYQRDGLLGTLDDYLNEPFRNGNPLTITIPKAHLNTTFIESLHGDLGSCSSTCNHLWDGFGQWKNNQWKPYLQESYDWALPLRYKQNGTFWVYGDSLALRLVSSVQTRMLCTKLFTGCISSYNWIYPIVNEAVEKELDDDLDFNPERVIETILAVLRHPLMQQRESSVLLLNLGIHYPIGVNFTTYQKLIGDLINKLKETRVDSQGNIVPKYKAKIIWKTSSAVHKEKAQELNKTHWRFFTTQRVAMFSSYAMSAMCEAGFDVIDIYPMTDSYPGGTLDVVHYPNHVFSSMITMLEKYKVNNYRQLSGNETLNRIKRCIG